MQFHTTPTKYTGRHTPPHHRWMDGFLNFYTPPIIPQHSSARGRSMCSPQCDININTHSHRSRHVQTKGTGSHFPDLHSHSPPLSECHRARGTRRARTHEAYFERSKFQFSMLAFSTVVCFVTHTHTHTDRATSAVGSRRPRR